MLSGLIPSQHTRATWNSHTTNNGGNCPQVSGIRMTGPLHWVNTPRWMEAKWSRERWQGLWGQYTKHCSLSATGEGSMLNTVPSTTTNINPNQGWDDQTYQKITMRVHEERRSIPKLSLNATLTLVQLCTHPIQMSYGTNQFFFLLFSHRLQILSLTETSFK
jgi:hypothetical protein